jgi:hypothetical protein
LHRLDLGEQFANVVGPHGERLGRPDESGMLCMTQRRRQLASLGVIGLAMVRTETLGGCERDNVVQDLDLQVGRHGNDGLVLEPVGQDMQLLVSFYSV